MLAVKKWLDNVPSERLRNKEQRCRPQHHRPTGVDGRSYGYWKDKAAMNPPTKGT